jgi:hypothetical protein
MNGGQEMADEAIRQNEKESHIASEEARRAEEAETRLEGGGGVNRANLKFTRFKHNYKPGLALELE